MMLECEDCGSLPYVEIEGSCASEEFQGTIFHFYPNRRVKIRPEDTEDFAGRGGRWFKTIQEYVMEGGDATCPKCKKAAYVES